MLHGMRVVRVVALATVGLVLVAPNRARADGAASGVSTVHACQGPLAPGRMQCEALVVQSLPQPGVGVVGTAVTPQILQAAYQLPVGTAGAGSTVAIVDAFDDPNAATDLTTYRALFGLPPCTTTTGCFRKIDQNGGTSYPAPDAGWAEEISLDLDMVSAACPLCNIVLVEAGDNTMPNLGTAENRAASLHPAAISNSWGGPEFSGETADDGYFNHPGIAITFGSGDSGYGVSYPAASPYVTAVGGTSLWTAAGAPRGFYETAWSGAGSGCSAFEAKPSWQHDSGCGRRTVADVSADADPNTGAEVVDSYGTTTLNSLIEVGGTSMSTPIIAAVFALAGDASPGPSIPYNTATFLWDVTEGSNGACSPAYLCTAETGYDGPTGLGTPAGTLAFRTLP